VLQLTPSIDPLRATPSVTHQRRGPLDVVRQWKPTPAVATAAIAATSVAYAFATFFARHLADAGISPVAVAFYRFALSAIVLAGLVNLRGDKRRPTCWALLSGLLMGLGWIAYVHAIEVGDVASAGVAYMTYPFFALVAGRLLFKIHLTARAVAGAALVLLAAAVGLGANPTGGFPAVVLIAPATFGFAVTVLTERLGPLDPFERLGAVALGATVGLSPLLATMAPAQLIPATSTAFLWIVGIGVGSALIPMTIYAAAAPAIGSARTAVAGAAELPTVFLIGAAFFGESIRVGHGLAAILILAAITLTPTTRVPHVSPTEKEDCRGIHGRSRLGQGGRSDPRRRARSALLWPTMVVLTGRTDQARKR
jgi:drug/metabolite transporter (DMT)-like permease